jgi:hypothetical protein
MDSHAGQVDPPDAETWSVEFRFEEEGAKTVAVATLTAGKRMLHTRGTARRSPRDPSRPRVGEDLAVSRALSQLAHDLVSDAVSQLEAATHAAARIPEA